MAKKEKTNISYSIFDNPAEHNDKGEKEASKFKKKIILLIGLFLVVGIIVAATLLAKNLLPEKEENDSSKNSFKPISVITTDVSNFKSVKIETDNSSLLLFCESEVSKEGMKETHWYAEGFEKIDIGSSVYSALNSAADITAISEITKKSAKECGFNEPQMKITVETHNDKGYTILIGNSSPDGLGVYLTLEGKDKIYLVENSLLDDFNIDIESILSSYNQTA